MKLALNVFLLSVCDDDDDTAKSSYRLLSLQTMELRQISKERDMGG